MEYELQIASAECRKMYPYFIKVFTVLSSHSDSYPNIELE